MLEQTALGTHRVTAHRLSAQEISSLVTFFVADFEKLRKKKTEKGQKKEHKWEPPQPGCYKINIDAAFRAKSNTGGWGFVARDNTGEFLDGGCGSLEHVTSPIHAEALAALNSL